MIIILKLKIMKLKNDYKMILLMFGLTLVMTAVFGAVSYSSNVTVFGFIDEDNSELSQLLFDELNNNMGYIFEKFDLEEGKSAVKKDSVSGAVYIKKDFMKEILNNNSVTIERLLVTEDMNNIQLDSLLLSGFNRVIMNYNLATGLSDVIKTTTDNKNIIEIRKNIYSRIDEHWMYKKPITISEIKLKEVIKYDQGKHSVIGFSLFFAMFTIVFGISEILIEREDRTWNRQLVSPLSKFSIITGNIIGTFIVGFLQVSLVFLISKFVFKMNWTGNVFHLLLIIGAFVYSVTAFGLVIANFVQTIGQLSAISPIIITGSAMIGGSFWPLEIVTSKVMLFLANLTPQKWAMSAIKDIAVYGYGFDKVLFSFSVLVGMGVAYTILGTVLLNKKNA